MRTKTPAKAPRIPPAINQLLVQNVLLERQAWLRKLLDPRRDLDKECGHPQDVSVDDYKREFLRGDIAARVVSLFPEESWSDSPQVFETEDEKETEFETAWEELEEALNLYSMLQRVDILSGIGKFGILLLGTDDGLPLSEPAPGVGEDGEPAGKVELELLFVRAFDEALVTVKSLESNITNPRYGLPTFYQVQFTDTALGLPVTAPSQSVTLQEVHWSRVIHVADNRTSSEIFGLPRMEKVFNRLLDVKKIAGGSGEMFWKGGFPGISLETMPTVEGMEIEFDVEATKAQLEKYMNGLQRYIATTGMRANSLNVQVADPGPHLEVQMRLIATAMGVPWRVFIGSEAAQLASEQDSKAWNKRINRRRQEYLNPFILNPFIRRLVMFGVLPEPKEIIIKWPDLNTLGDLDKSTVAEKRSNALAKYVQAGVDTLIPPFHYLTQILGMKDDEARAIIDAAGEVLDSTDGGDNPLKQDAILNPPPTPVVVAPGGARGNGKPVKATKPVPARR